MHGIIVLNRNGNRRPNTRRRRKKASPAKTITLWALFLLFTLSASVLFLLLVYLDLVSNNKNSRELAICCGAFGVSLLTALRIWVSLPDELTQPEAGRCPAPPGHRAVTPGPVATCSLSQCHCDLERVSSGRMVQVYHHNTGPRDEALEINEIRQLVSTSDQNPPPSYIDCLQLESPEPPPECQDDLPPSYSSLQLNDEDEDEDCLLSDVCLLCEDKVQKSHLPPEYGDEAMSDGMFLQNSSRVSSFRPDK